MGKHIIDGETYETPDGWRLISDVHYWRWNGLVTILSDLDRSEHGRHEGDVEAQTPGGVSLGNPLFQTGAQIGFTMGGDPIVVPPRGMRSDPEAWHRPSLEKLIAGTEFEGMFDQ